MRPDPGEVWSGSATRRSLPKRRRRRNRSQCCCLHYSPELHRRLTRLVKVDATLVLRSLTPCPEQWDVAPGLYRTLGVIEILAAVCLATPSLRECGLWLAGPI